MKDGGGMKKTIFAALVLLLCFSFYVERVDNAETAPPPSLAPSPVVLPSIDINVAEGVTAAPEPDKAEPEWTEYEATAYCACEKCCGTWAEDRPDGIVYTASGAVAQEGVTIAADWDVLPPGTVVFIDGLGERVVQDRGGAIKGNAVDIYFEDHDEALIFGRQTVRLYIVEGGDSP